MVEHPSKVFGKQKDLCYHNVYLKVLCLRVSRKIDNPLKLYQQSGVNFVQTDQPWHLATNFNCWLERSSVQPGGNPIKEI